MQFSIELLGLRPATLAVLQVGEAPDNEKGILANAEPFRQPIAYVLWVLLAASLLFWREFLPI